MVFSVNDLVALQLPDFGTATLSKNSVNLSVQALIQNSLDTVGGYMEPALALIFLMLASEQILLSETIGRYSYTKQKDFFMERYEFWNFRAIALGFVCATPEITYGGNYLGLGITGYDLGNMV